MFAVNDDGFVKDNGFDYSSVILNCRSYASEDAPFSDIMENVDLDVSDIYPTILLACIKNTYAYGMSHCIGLDFTLNDFSKRAVKAFELPLPASYPDAPIRVLHYFWDIILECNETGKINTKKWNNAGRDNEMIEVFRHKHTHCSTSCDKTCYGSIQGIVKTARRIQEMLIPKN